MMKQRILAMLLAGTMAVGVIPAYAAEIAVDDSETVQAAADVPDSTSEGALAAAEDGIYYSTDTEASADAGDAGNLTAASGVTKEMGDASYWTAKSLLGADRVLASTDDINAYNKSAYDSSGTKIMGIESFGDTCTAKNRIPDIPDGSWYINGEQINNEEYFGHIRDEYTASCIAAGTSTPNRWAICVKEADVKAWPTADVIGDSADDSCDEMQDSSMLVNEPFVIQQECTVDGVLYYWGYTDNLWGWVAAENVALCSSKDEWLSAWNFDRSEKDILVVTQDKIVLEPSLSNSYSSKVQLDMGAVLKLVPEEDWTEEVSQLAERGTWNNYVVYLPTRDEDGNYAERVALVSQHYSVSVGYLPLTEANVMKTAFSCLGNRYGWGGMLESLDCTHFTRNLYRCFGYQLPSNTTSQPKVAGYTIDISAMTDDEKAAYLATCPLGSLLYMKGHAMVYVGNVDGVPYCISAAGSLSDSDGELNVQQQHSIILTPMTVRRSASYSGTTWLHNITSVVTFTDLRHTDHSYGDWTVTKEETCTEDGSQERTCELCGTVEQQAIPASGHTEVKDAAVAATISRTGKTAGSHCSVCDAVIQKQKTIAKLTPTIRLSRTSKTLKAKKSITVKVTYQKGDSVKLVTSSNKSVATVKKTAAGRYKITAKKKGTATITFRLKSWKKASCKIKVK